MGRLAFGRPSIYCLDLNLRHSDTDPKAIERGRFVTTADRPTHIDKLLVAQGAANYQFFHFPVDDVVIAEFEQYTQRRSLTGVFGEIWKRREPSAGSKTGGEPALPNYQVSICLFPVASLLCLRILKPRTKKLRRRTERYPRGRG